MRAASWEPRRAARVPSSLESSRVCAIPRGLVAEDACSLPVPREVMALGSRGKAWGRGRAGCAEGRGWAQQQRKPLRCGLRRVCDPSCGNIYLYLFHLVGLPQPILKRINPSYDNLYNH